MIELNNVKKIYKSKNGSETIALDNISLKIGNSGMVAIVGESGSGKSTFLNLLGGLDKITSGNIKIGDRDLNSFTDKDYDAYRNSCIGFIFQEFNILEQYNVYDNILLSLNLQEKECSKETVDILLDKIGIKELGNRKVNELSGGQKQRVAIARALIKNPKIILADEPTGNLDSQASESIFSLLKEISKDQLVIIVTHNIKLAKKYADRVFSIQDGKITYDSMPLSDTQVEKLELKNSKLPFKYALKMAITSFKSKPAKLISTIILMTMALIFMGFSINGLAFDRLMLITNTMKDNNNYIYDVTKVDYEEEGQQVALELEKSDIKKIKKLTDSKLNLVYSLFNNGEHLKFEFGKQERKDAYFKQEIGALSFVKVDDLRLTNNIIGRKIKNSNEIIIHKYLAEYAIKYGIMTSENKLYFPKDFNDLVTSNKKIKLGDNEVIIVGIIDDDNSLYSDVKKGLNFETDELKAHFIINYINKSHIIYVDGFIEKAKLGKDKFSVLKDITITNSNYDRAIYEGITILNKDINFIGKNGLSSIKNLNKEEVILTKDTIRKFDNTFDGELTKYLALHNTEPEEIAFSNFMKEYINNKGNRLNICLNINANGYNNECKYLNVIGISLDDNNYISKDYVDEYEPITKKVTNVKIYEDKINKLRNSFRKMVFNDCYSEKMDSGIYYLFSLDHADEIWSIGAIYELVAKYILIISAVFIFFSFLLFSNFITTSINYCKKEIGILRALGTRNKDVNKIFGYEALIIGIIAWILSVIGWYIVCDLLNNSLFGKKYFIINGVVTHPIIPIIMFIYTLGISLLISYAVSNKIGKIKPIDAILNK